MVLNFGILKILFSTPTRSDQYKAGPLEVTLIKAAITKMGANKTIIKQEERMRSNNLFIDSIIALKS
jgi:hypothetical protein